MEIGIAIVFVVGSVVLLRMNKKHAISISIVYLLAVIYLAFLVREPTPTYRYSLKLFDAASRSLEFGGVFISGLLSGNVKTLGWSSLKGIVLNILLFIPFGYLIPVVWPQKEWFWWKILLLGLVTSFCIEITQLVYRPLNKWTIYPNYDIIPSRTYSWRFIMGRTASSIELSIEDRKYLESQMRARTIQAQTVERARILILKADGKPIDDIAALIGMNRKSVMLCLKKYKEGGVENALFDAPGRGRNAEITDDEKTWIINIACKKPTDFGYAAETWTYAKLTAHVNLTAEASGYTRLSTVNKSTVHKILDDAEIKPFRINYYCEQRDPDFDRKMHNVLLVYKQLSMQFDKNGQLVPFEDDEAVHVLSYDEKPGVQAISTTSDDLLPNGSNGAIQRDYEYKRLGTVSLLTAIDLQTGEAIPLVSETHNSKDYIKFLRILDDKYPAGDKIRIVLDNLKVHTSVETRRFLATLPGRFEFVFTPKHGSWLNLVEGFFSKMTRQMLRGIRVKTKEELISRIHRYFDEVNEHPVVYHWKYKLDDVDITEEIGTDTLLLEQSS